MQYMQTAIYIRVSTEEQVTEGFSIHAQKDKLTKYAEVNDWNIVDYYVDDGISGKNLNERPEVLRLIKDVESRKVNNVLVYKLDRLTRSVKDLIYLIDLFDRYDCTFNSQTEKIDTSNAVGRMFVKIIGIFAEFERENLAERVTFGYEQKTKEGNYTNCNGVFGYDYLIGKGKLRVNQEEAYYVAQIYDWYLTGDSMLKIANRLKALNVPTKRGGQWNQSTISSILTNPLYIGNVRYGINKKNGFEVVGKNITPILNQNIFYNVQELLNKRKKYHNKRNSSDDTYYFRVLRCAYCGSKYHARQQIQNGKKYINYKCDGHYNKVCNAPGFSHNKLENAFLKYLDKVKDFDFDEKVFMEKSIVDSDRGIEKIKKQIFKVNKKKENIIKSFSMDEIDYDTFQGMSDVVDSKLTILKNQLKTLRNNQYSIPNMDEKLIRRVIVNLRNNFINLNKHEKKIFLERFVKLIKVKKEENNVIIETIEF